MTMQYLRIVFSLISIALMCNACEEKVDLVRVFVIRKGEHYATPRVLESLQTSTIRFQARFDASAVYDFRQEGFQDSKNKLFGFSDCNDLHHDNSARFAWQWFNDRVEIFAYCYVDGERVEAFVGTVGLNEFSDYRISITDGYYEFQLNGGEPVRIKRGSVCERGVYYKLWPYFGGTLPAPHDVTIAIRES